VSTLRVNNISDASGGNSNLNIPGTAKAWVNFNGTDTVAIRASLNVSSITDNGTGDYTVNFATAMVDANYSVSASASPVFGGNSTLSIGLFSDSSNSEVAPTTTAVRVQCEFPTTNTNLDVKYFCVSIFR
jgi:hypothetical protein